MTEWNIKQVPEQAAECDLCSMGDTPCPYHADGGRMIDQLRYPVWVTLARNGVVWMCRPGLDDVIVGEWDCDSSRQRPRRWWAWVTWPVDSDCSVCLEGWRQREMRQAVEDHLRQWMKEQGYGRW